MVEWRDDDDDDDGDDDFFMRRRRLSLCSCLSRADESNVPFAQQFTPVLVVGDILQAVFVGHTLPEIPPPPARGALEPVVGTKTFSARSSIGSARGYGVASCRLLCTACTADTV